MTRRCRLLLMIEERNTTTTNRQGRVRYAPCLRVRRDPGSTRAQIMHLLHGRWRTATRLIMVILSTAGMPPAQIADLLGYHAATVQRWAYDHPRLRLLYGAAYSPHDNPVERIWATLKAHLANTAVTWTERIHQARVFFRRRTPEQMLATAAPWTSPWLPRSYAQNFREPA